jgi:hypothetical protein
VLNKYYPPDFDPNKIPRRKMGKDRQYKVRLMAPFNMRCVHCGDYIYKGKKFDAQKETVMDEVRALLSSLAISCTAHTPTAARGCLLACLLARSHLPARSLTRSPVHAHTNNCMISLVAATRLSRARPHTHTLANCLAEPPHPLTHSITLHSLRPRSTWDSESFGSTSDAQDVRAPSRSRRTRRTQITSVRMGPRATLRTGG